jgi:hypothetical protein
LAWASRPPPYTRLRHGADAGGASIPPSVGLLLKFTDDLVTLVLVRGSNLDALVKQSVNLTDRGFQRHRVLWLEELDEGHLRQATEGEPTIDRIEVTEFEPQEELRAWLKKAAPALLRSPP